MRKSSTKPLSGDVRGLDGSDGRRGGRPRGGLAARVRGQLIRLHLFRDIHRVRGVFHPEPVHRRHNRQFQHAQKKGAACFFFVLFFF